MIEYKYEREYKEGISALFVLLKFILKEKDVLTDKMIKETIAQEGLRPVSQEEFKIFQREIIHGGKPEIRIVAYGNAARGSSETGSFCGTPFLNTSGKIGIVENWTRGQDGDAWEGEWKFLFVPLS
jgi:hypothetical protein